MLHRLLLLSLLVCAAPSLAAQDHRVSVVPRVGYASLTPLYEHTVSFQGPGGRTARQAERLEVEAFRTAGARVIYHAGRAWQVYGDVAHGGSAAEFTSRMDAGELFALSESRTTAGATSVGLGVGRRVAAHPRAPFLDLNLGGELHRVRVGQKAPPCSPGPPSLGISPPCGSAVWERTYDVPSLAAGFGVGHRISGRMGIQAGATYSRGVANTENFWTDLIPEYDHLEAPRAHRVDGLRAAVGLSIEL